ncbi:MAG: response regulator transcription factor [Deinococcales bacterium]
MDQAQNPDRVIEMNANRQQPHLLLVEDEDIMAEILAENFEQEGYQVSHAEDGAKALSLWQSLKPDVVVLDVMLPYVNGYDICSQMRQQGDSTPVLFLSAKGESQDRIAGLKAGGDDYLPKPFDLTELLLRLNNLLKRQGWGAESTQLSFSFAGHTVNYRGYSAKLASGKEEILGEKELAIFKLLASHADEVVSRDDILDEVWGEEAFPSSRTVDNFVMRLRKLFEPDPTEPRYFHTIWGVGYKFTPWAGENVSTS